MENETNRNLMKAVRFHQYGGPEVLMIEEVEMPEPAPDQILIEVKAVGVNRFDVALRSGIYQDFIPQTFPAGVGYDASGIVVSKGTNVSNVEIGDAVFGNGKDTVAKYAVLNNWVIKPDSISFEEAAGFPAPVETATRVLQDINLVSGETLLISGAAGSVGTALIQLAKAEGINIIGTASKPRHNFLKSLGVIPTTYDAGLKDRVATLAPNGIQGAADLAASGILPDLIEITGNPQKVVTIVDKTAHIYGVKGSFAPRNPVKAFENIIEMVNAGLFTLPVAEVFTIDQVGEAHTISSSSHAKGRLIIRID